MKECTSCRKVFPRDSFHNRNPFEWSAGLAELERERFHRLVKYLAELNGIAAVEDYETHVNHCFK